MKRRSLEIDPAKMSNIALNYGEEIEYVCRMFAEIALAYNSSSHLPIMDVHICCNVCLLATKYIKRYN